MKRKSKEKGRTWHGERDAEGEIKGKAQYLD